MSGAREKDCTSGWGWRDAVILLTVDCLRASRLDLAGSFGAPARQCQCAPARAPRLRRSLLRLQSPHRLLSVQRVRLQRLRRLLSRVRDPSIRPSAPCPRRRFRRRRAWPRWPPADPECGQPGRRASRVTVGSAKARVQARVPTGMRSSRDAQQLARIQCSPGDLRFARKVDDAGVAAALQQTLHYLRVPLRCRRRDRRRCLLSCVGN
jgi:hypothetical protein